MVCHKFLPCHLMRKVNLQRGCGAYCRYLVEYAHNLTFLTVKVWICGLYVFLYYLQSNKHRNSYSKSPFFVFLLPRIINSCRGLDTLYRSTSHRRHWTSTPVGCKDKRYDGLSTSTRGLITGSWFSGSCDSSLFSPFCNAFLTS